MWRRFSALCFVACFPSLDYPFVLVLCTGSSGGPRVDDPQAPPGAHAFFAIRKLWQAGVFRARSQFWPPGQLRHVGSGTRFFQEAHGRVLLPPVVRARSPCQLQPRLMFDAAPTLALVPPTGAGWRGLSPTLIGSSTSQCLRRPKPCANNWRYRGRTFSAGYVHQSPISPISRLHYAVVTPKKRANGIWL